MSKPYIQRYKRPPITEAVIEFRLRDQLNNDQIQKVADRAKKRYAFDDTEYAQTIQVGPQSSQVGKISQGRRLSSVDRADLMIIRPPTLSISRLAPYKGWDELFDSAQMAWDDLRHFVGKPLINRIGVRFINRIDAPAELGAASELVGISPSFPTLPNSQLKQSFVQITLDLKDGFQALINSLPADSPVPNNVSWLLDIDISRENAIPIRDDEMWMMIQRMRELKNWIFESLITEKARERFV
jgi:uncharacterized protein (TIGR04255 family)